MRTTATKRRPRCNGASATPTAEMVSACIPLYHAGLTLEGACSIFANAFVSVAMTLNHGRKSTTARRLGVRAAQIRRA